MSNAFSLLVTCFAQPCKAVCQPKMRITNAYFSGLSSPVWLSRARKTSDTDSPTSNRSQSSSLSNNIRLTLLPISPKPCRALRGASKLDHRNQLHPSSRLWRTKSQSPLSSSKWMTLHLYKRQRRNGSRLSTRRSTISAAW